MQIDNLGNIIFVIDDEETVLLLYLWGIMLRNVGVRIWWPLNLQTWSSELLCVFPLSPKAMWKCVWVMWNPWRILFNVFANSYINLPHYGWRSSVNLANSLLWVSIQYKRIGQPWTNVKTAISATFGLFPGECLQVIQTVQKEGIHWRPTKSSQKPQVV